MKAITVLLINTTTKKERTLRYLLKVFAKSDMAKRLPLPTLPEM